LLKATFSRISQSPAAPALSSALLAVLLYAITVGGTYVYDDEAIVRDDPRVRHIHEWARIWTTDYFDGGADHLYRPLVTSSYALEWYLHGDRPWIFHAINILLHALAAAAVAEFTRRALIQTRVAASAPVVAGLLFAAHPVHVEAVANIVGRAELLCTSCIFLGLILLLQRPLKSGRVIAVLSISAVAVLSKEQGILQPLLWLLLIALLWKHPLDQQRKSLQLFLLLTSWLWAGYLIVREHFLRFEWDLSTLDTVQQPLVLSHGIDRLLMPVVILGRYSLLLLWPRHLSPDYGGDVIGSIAHASDPFLWIGFVALGLWTISIFTCFHSFEPQRRRDTEKRNTSPHSSPIPYSLRVRVSAVQNSSIETRFVIFCLIALGITYGMIGNVVSLIATIFGERLLYLPSAFFLMIVAVLISHLPRFPRNILLFVALSLASLRTVTAARDWNHPAALFENALGAQPKSVQLHFLLAEQYQKMGNPAGAFALLKQISERYPGYWPVWMRRAEQDIQDHQIDDARMSLKRAMKLKADPKLWYLDDQLQQLEASTRPAGNKS
jgi:protein O-mannosyl-transferase